MRKYIPKASFQYDGYQTSFITKDKKLASIILEHEAENVAKIVEKLEDGKMETYSYDNGETLFVTTDMNLAIVVFEYLDKNSVNIFKETIKEIKAKL